ncbi:MAG: NAD(P)H-dependent glycerol-3-phosphate dehydrogenase [Bacilli bacterium]|nr:NAD(P)H-dependent glycerol-3-phosphate dehydrogenase [Bacilli bacterium]
MKIGILGCGAYGLALSNILKKDNNILMWTKFSEEKENLEKNRSNDKVLPGYKLDDSIKVTTDLEYCIKDSDLLIIVIPILFLEETVISMKPYINNHNILIATKGITSDGLLAHDVIENNLNTKNVGVLSGPTFAIDLVSNNIAGFTIASKSKSIDNIVDKVFIQDNLKIEYISDLVGTEICGSIKNVLAISAGILSGLRSNESGQAMVLTEMINEIKYIIEKLGSDSNTILSFAGIGDILLTCTSTKSRNFSLGKLIGEGKSKEEIKKYLENTTVEGVYTLKAMKKLLDNNSIKSDDVDVIYNVVFNNRNPKDLLTYYVNKSKEEIC